MGNFPCAIFVATTFTLKWERILSIFLISPAYSIFISNINIFLLIVSLMGIPVHLRVFLQPGGRKIPCAADELCPTHVLPLTCTSEMKR